MGGLPARAFWGAVFHAFFPAETGTWPGFIAWIPVALRSWWRPPPCSSWRLRVLAPRPRRAHAPPVVVAAYAAAFAAVVLLVDESFGSIVRFYVPALLLFLLAAAVRAIRDRGGWVSDRAGSRALGRRGAAPAAPGRAPPRVLRSQRGLPHGPGCRAGDALRWISRSRRSGVGSGMRAERIRRIAADERVARHAGFWWGLAEGVVFFIVPDVYISVAALFSLPGRRCRLGWRRSRARWWRSRASGC